MAGACGGPRVAHRDLPPPSARAQGALRVMSYNVNFGIAGDPSTIAAISAATPDLVLLQETNDRWEEALVNALGEAYPHHRFDPPDSQWVAGGMGVLSKFPIVRIDKLPPPRGGLFFAWRVVVDAPLGRIQVFNVHLRPPMSDGGSWVAGYFTTRDDRRREILYHLDAYDPAQPALFVGDFNEEGDGKAVRLLEDRGFFDTIPRFAGAARTWSWTVRGGITLRFQLDHILHDVHFVATAAGVIDAGRSDHKPVWADFIRLDP